MVAKRKIPKSDGFTLIEILVAVAIAGVVAAGIYAAYYSQQKSYLAQEQVAAMQQNLRAAMYFMEREIRMAGCDPTGKSGAGFLTASADTVSFTADIRGDAEGSEPDGDTSDPNEAVSYTLSGGNLLRNTEMIAENIDALDSVYLDASNTVTANLASIRSVQVSVVAKTGRADAGYVDQNNYENQQGVEILAAPNDGLRRKLLTTHIKCRNLGL